MNAYDDALRFALKAQDLFTLSYTLCADAIGPQDEMFVNKIIEVAIDTYKLCRQGETPANLDNTAQLALTSLVDRIFDETIRTHDFKTAMALAFDTQRLDRIEETIKLAVSHFCRCRIVIHLQLAAGDLSILLVALEHALVTMDTSERANRDGALDLVLRMYEVQAEPDFVRMCQALIKLNRPVAVARLLTQLVSMTVSIDGSAFLTQTLTCSRRASYTPTSSRSICTNRLRSSSSVSACRRCVRRRPAIRLLRRRPTTRSK